jgi:hypothetical protein
VNPSPTKTAVRRPVVSVCVVNWNCRDQLRACLRSLTPNRQRLRLEVIVVDNASTDGAPDMVTTDFPRVRLIRNAENAGYARACNQAARAARGRYLFFLNNDTVIPRGALRRLVERARATPGLGLLGPRLRDGKGRVQRSVRARPSVSALCHRVTFLRWTGLFRGAHDGFRGEERRDQPHPAEVLMGAALLMPRRVWGQVGGWSEAYAFGRRAGGRPRPDDGHRPPRPRRLAAAPRLRPGQDAGRTHPQPAHRRGGRLGRRRVQAGLHARRAAAPGGPDRALAPRPAARPRAVGPARLARPRRPDALRARGPAGLLEGMSPIRASAAPGRAAGAAVSPTASGAPRRGGSAC